MGVRDKFLAQPRLASDVLVLPQNGNKDAVRLVAAKATIQIYGGVAAVSMEHLYENGTDDTVETYLEVAIDK